MRVAPTGVITNLSCLCRAMNRDRQAPIGLFGYLNGEVWVAEDVLVTRVGAGNLLVERLIGETTRSAVVPAGTRGLQALWVKLNELAADVPSDREG